MTTRRECLQWIGAGAALLPCSIRTGQAFPLNVPPGVQLWSVKDDLAADREATLKKIAGIGFRELELFQLPKMPAEFRQACGNAGLTCVSGHFELSSFGDAKTIAGAKQLGLQYMIVVFPGLRSLNNRDISTMDFGKRTKLYEGITLDDYKWDAEQLNSYGRRLKQEGLQLGYHNHAIDFKKFGDTLAIEALMNGTDPDLVVFEMDCGHVIHSGHDPIDFLKRHSNRIRLLHLKDLKAGYSVSTTLDTEDRDTNAEIGSGVIDWKQLFQVARQGNVKHCFVEEEGKMDHAPMESLAISYKYLQQL